MKADDQAARTSRIDGSLVQLDWPAAGEAARQAASDRLRSLFPGGGPSSEEADPHSAGGPLSVDDELARLVFDSAFDAELVTTVRAGEGSSRQLTFEARGVALELEVLAGQLVGQLVPPQRAVVELRHRRGTTQLKTDELGCFQVPLLPKGPVSFRCLPAETSAPSLATSWITL